MKEIGIHSLRRTLTQSLETETFDHENATLDELDKLKIFVVVE
jgi:hypothetical protein